MKRSKGKQIRLSDSVYEELKKRSSNFEDSPDSVLRALLGMSSKNAENKRRLIDAKKAKKRAEGEGDYNEKREAQARAALSKVR